MIQIIKADLFQSDADCITNTVNSVGVMGAGVAKRFKEKYPRECEAFNRWSKGSRYMRLCAPRANRNLIAQCNVSTLPYSISSQILFLRKSIPAAFRLMQDLQIQSLAMPWPGCGNGGLDKKDVLPIIEEHKHIFSGEITIHEQ